MTTSILRKTLWASAWAAAACSPGFAQTTGMPATANLPTAADIPMLSGVAPRPGAITAINVPTTTLVSDPKLTVHVAGTGKLCQYHLVVINTDTGKESYFPQTSKFPALVHANLPLDQFAHGQYKVAAMAWGSDKSSGMGCQGGGEYTAFKIERQKINVGSDWPKITDLTLTTGKSAAPNVYRVDESLAYAVQGSVDNQAPQNADKRCGWTVTLDGNGQSTQLGNGTFFKMPMSASWRHSNLATTR